MFPRLGLRFRMTVSYVVTTAVAVLVVEAVLLILVAPVIRSARDATLDARNDEAHAQVLSIAVEDATTLSLVAGSLRADRPQTTDAQLLDAVAQQGFGLLTLQSPRKGVTGPPGDAEVLTAPDGTVVRSSVSSAYPLGTKLPAIITGTNADKNVDWATRPVVVVDTAPGKTAREPEQRQIGVLYVQLSGETRLVDRAPDATPTAADVVTDTGGLLLPGLVILLLLVPLGIVFGLLSTRRLIRRIRRLVGVTSAMTKGDRQARIPVSGGDEVGRLEDGFNRMAERLEAAVEVERYTAGVQARWAERTRIARELHDSVSQDLFSMSLIANGLREALPEADRLRHQAESLEQTVNRTMLEMRTMLLELRPIALEDAGLVPALRELCRAHETRLGIPVAAELAPVRLPPELEHTVLRVAQEALSNAARHAEPRAIELSLAEADGQVVVTVHDDGRGFDPVRVVGGHGMGLEMMRGRVAELGGTLNLTSGPGRGTTVRVRIPRGDR